MQFFKQPNINFIGIRKAFFYVSLIVTLSGLIGTIVLGIDYGIDFTGGTEIAVKFDNNIQTQDIRDAIIKSGIASEEIKSYGKENQFLIRLKESTKVDSRIEDALRAAFPTNPVTIMKSDVIGPKIGMELRTQALLAVFLAIIAMLIYIAFRFEFIYGLGAIVALVHDVIFTFSIVIFTHNLGLMNLEVNQSIIAAMLTVVGYSVNDTVIIFDRIRENLVKHKGMNFFKLANLSINETLSRTINTVLTVVIVLLTMVILAGPVLQGFAFTMLIGIIIGTYSSMYIASSFVIWYLEKVKKTLVEEDSQKAKVAAIKA